MSSCWKEKNSNGKKLLFGFQVKKFSTSHAFPEFLFLFAGQEESEEICFANGNLEDEGLVSTVKAFKTISKGFFALIVKSIGNRISNLFISNMLKNLGIHPHLLDIHLQYLHFSVEKRSINHKSLLKIAVKVKVMLRKQGSANVQVFSRAE